MSNDFRLPPIGFGPRSQTEDETLEYMPVSEDGRLREVFDTFNEINISLDLQDAALPYAPYIDGALLPDLFEGATR